MLVRSSSAGKSALDTYFEIVGGYEDGSVARRLHISYRSLEDSLDLSELRELLPPELFDSVIDLSKFDEDSQD